MKALILSLALLPATLIAGEALSCTNDVDCACGQVCSWKTTTHTCVSANGGDPGWCTGSGSSTCLYVGQTCDTSTPACTPAWSTSSVCTLGTTGGSGGGSSGGSSSSGGTAGDAGTSGGGGGCSSAPGEIGWATALLAVGLLFRSRRRES